MNASRKTTGSSTLLRALFILISVLVLVAVGYAAWIAVDYWGRVGV